MSVYLDTSVLVSIAVADINRDRARSFTVGCREPTILSDFGLLEVASAISRLVRIQRVSPVEARQSIAQFHVWAARAVTEISLEPPDVAFAEAAVVRFDTALKAPDALHVAIAHRIRATLVTFDRKQAEGARRLGIATVEP